MLCALAICCATTGVGYCCVIDLLCCALITTRYVELRHAFSNHSVLRTKQTEDYAQTLLLCKDHEYTMILEDDVVPTKNWFKKLERRIL